MNTMENTKLTNLVDKIIVALIEKSPIYDYIDPQWLKEWIKHGAPVEKKAFIIKNSS